MCKPSLKLILAQTLKLFGLSPHLQRIQGVVDAVLCELRDGIFIVGGLAELRMKPVNKLLTGGRKANLQILTKLKSHGESL